MSEPRPTQAAWSDVDRTAAPQAFTAYLDTLRTLPAIREYKLWSDARLRLRPGARALELGCGTGDDARRLVDQVGPTGEVIGIDYAEAMVEESTRRWGGAGLPLRFLQGDVHALPLPDHHVDAARADRVFQHLANPAQALAELVRVTRPGGRVVLCDPDWGSYLVDLPPTPACRRYLDFAQQQARNPWIGRQFFGLLRAAGLGELELGAHVALIVDLAVLERLGNLDAGFITAVEAGQLSAEEVEQVRAELRARQAAGCFFASVTVYTAAGTTPG